MPNKNGTGSRKSGGGRMRGQYSAGSCGNCVCPQCGTIAPHQQGQPCAQNNCPKCGTQMTRQ